MEVPARPRRLTWDKNKDLELPGAHLFRGEAPGLFVHYLDLLDVGLHNRPWRSSWTRTIRPSDTSTSSSRSSVHTGRRLRAAIRGSGSSWNCSSLLSRGLCWRRRTPRIGRGPRLRERFAGAWDERGRVPRRDGIRNETASVDGHPPRHWEHIDGSA